MKKIIIGVALLGFIISCKEKKKETKEEAVAEIEVPKNDWEVLFDGTSLDKWKEFKSDSVSDVWKIEGEALVYTPPGEGGEKKNHDLVTRKDYTDFVLSLDWKISEAGNSGVFWGVKEDSMYRTGYQTGPEVQILDNEKHPDAKAGTTHQSGALYDMVAPVKDVTNPVGDWNTMVITVNHKEHKGSVMLNGVEVVTFPLSNEKWDAMVADSKFAGWEGFGKFTTGKIGLQDHHNVVSFKNIKIKQL
ncbi:3-keto-disaccharide hydrolase [Maribacter sp. X9]|uniref:3-keto-disaccharide hydrolase n=1 Tax=Maribacter sp. X9 TaxID=3402159 RepID=UPI003AF3A4C5